ncbi:MAG: magnesium/cobalt transporter CorA [Dehalococcoidia bacterium]|nr:magnesium/cobalt transporter CorA [Dehalococcoidia bacterium]
MRSLHIDFSHNLRESLASDEIAAVLKDPSGLLWLDLTTGDECRAILEDVFRFHPLAIEDCFDGVVDPPKIDDYGDYLFIISQSVASLDPTGRLDLSEVDLFLGSNYVVTSSPAAIQPLEELFERARANPQVLKRGADFLAHSILDALVDLLLPAVEAMDEQIDDIEQRLLDHPDKSILPEILLFKRNALRLRRSILPQRDLVNHLSRGEYSQLIRAEAQIFYRDIYDHIVRVDEMLDGLRDLADGALSSYLSAVNNRMNEVMKALSVVASIFLPLTLIASIFGTNLDYSPFGLSFKAGFWLMLAGMIALSAALILFFRRRGWF